jgi:hypothetical protein
MTQQEHEAQRNLVMLSLLLCPPGGRHEGKGHDAKDRAKPAQRH